MCEIGSLVEHFSDSQVSDLDTVFLGQEHVDGLDVSVQDLVGVQVLKA